MASKCVKEPKLPGVWVGASGGCGSSSQPSRPLPPLTGCQSHCCPLSLLQSWPQGHHQAPPGLAVIWSRPQNVPGKFSNAVLLPWKQEHQSCHLPPHHLHRPQPLTCPVSPCLPPHLLCYTQIPSHLILSRRYGVFRPLCLSPDQGSASLFCRGAGSQCFRLCRPKALCCNYSTPPWKHKSKHGPGCLCPSKALFVKARGRA